MKKRALIIAGITIVAIGAALSGICLATGNCSGQKTTSITEIPLNNPVERTKPANENIMPGLPGETTNKIHWITSLDEAQKQSTKTGKPIFVDFYATWCAPCKMMDEQTYINKDVISEAQKWIMVRIDTDKQTDIAIKYGIQALPTLAILKSDGNPVTGAGGFLDANDFISFLRKGQKKM